MQNDNYHRLLFAEMKIGFVEYDARRAQDLLDAFRSEGIVDVARHLLTDHGRMKAIRDAIDVVAVNDALLEMLHLSRSDHAETGISWLLPKDADAVIAAAMQTRYDGTILPPTCATLWLEDGTKVVIEMTIVRIPGASSISAVFDATSRVESQQKIDQLRSEFAHASRISMFGELSTTLAHEIGQPLAAIQMYATTALRRAQSSRMSDHGLISQLERIEGCSKRATEIVTQVRSQVAMPRVDQRAQSLNDVVRESLTFVEQEAERAGVRIALELDEDIPDTLMDRVQILQIVVNLAINAVQAMQDVPVGTRRLTLRTSGIVDRVMLDVEDAGPGFSATTEARLFEGFFTTKPDGMGIGLKVCRSIAEAHDGSLEARNTTSGACFSLSLPVRPKA